MLAPYVNQSITQLKNTSLVSVIAVPDLVYNATLINADTYRPLECIPSCLDLLCDPVSRHARCAAVERGMTYDKA